MFGVATSSITTLDVTNKSVNDGKKMSEANDIQLNENIYFA
jgi:hypothetical protein